MIIIDILKKILMIGEKPIEAVATAYNPAIGGLITLVLNSVLHAEASGGSGPEKREFAALSVQAAGSLVQSLFAAQNKAIKNYQLFSSGVDKLMEGVVDILNSTGDNTKPVK